MTFKVLHGTVRMVLVIIRIQGECDRDINLYAISCSGHSSNVYL